MFSLSLLCIGRVRCMDEEKEKIVDIVEKGLCMIQGTHAAIVISEPEEVNADNIEDHMRAHAFLNVRPVDLCIKANSKKGYVKVFDPKVRAVKTLFGNVEIIRWDMIAPKEDLYKTK